MLKEWLMRGEVVAAVGVFDGFSSLLAKRLDFKAVYMGGYCVTASRYGLPDAGLVGLAEMFDAVRLIRRTNDTPLIADGDTGYGGLLNVQHTVREYESLGVSAIQLEDQEMPKRCGHTKGKRVVSQREAVAKVEVAVASKKSDDFLVIARTDSLATHGMVEAIGRCKLFRAAGADIVFVDAPATLDEIKRIGEELGDSWLMLNMTPQRGFDTPDLSLDQLREMGYSLVIYPGLFAFPAVAAMEAAGTYFLSHGSMDQSLTPTFSTHALVGLEQVLADEERWERLYGPA